MRRIERVKSAGELMYRLRDWREGKDRGPCSSDLTCLTLTDTMPR